METEKMKIILLGLLFCLSTYADAFYQWTDKKISSESNLNSIFFSGPQYGWISGDRGIVFITTDSGNTWAMTDNSISDSISLKDIRFQDTLTGWTVGIKESSSIIEVLLKSSDAGRHWEMQKSWDVTAYYPISFVDVNSLVIIADSLYHSIDGGMSWNSMVFDWPGCVISSIYQTERHYFIAVGSYFKEGNLWESSDTGKSWINTHSILYSDVRNKQFTSIAFSTRVTGWIVGDSGLILKSSDSGIDWQRQFSPVQQRLEKVFFFNSQVGFIYGSNHILTTSNGGINWTDDTSFSKYKTHDVCFTSPLHIWAVGDSGVILHGYNENIKYVKVISPKIGDSVHIGDSLLVRWESNGISKVTIQTSYDSGINYKTYAAEIKNNGSAVVHISANAKPSDKCLIRVSDSEGTVESASGLFTIQGVNSILSDNASLKRNYALRVIGSTLKFNVPQFSRVTITLQTINGQTLFYRCIPSCKKGMYREELPIRNLMSGCYMVRTEIGAISFVQKFIVYR